MKDSGTNRRRAAQVVAGAIFAAGAILVAFALLGSADSDCEEGLPPQGTEAFSYNELVQPQTGLVASGRVEEVTVNTEDVTLDVELTSGDRFSTGYLPNTEDGLVNMLQKRDVTVAYNESGACQ